MGVNFSGKDRLMAEHFLDSPEVSSSIDQVGGKRVPEGMRADLLPQTYFFRKALNDGENHDPG